MFCGMLLGYTAVAGSPNLLFIALGTQWCLDFLDGFLARLLHQETRLGACIDAQTDRVVTCIFLFAMWHMASDAHVAILCYLVFLMLLDAVMFTQAMQTGVLSTNYYYEINLTAWRICWSPAGKFVTAVLIPVMIIMQQTRVLAVVIICVATAVRLPILRRVLINS
jgi:phosphatidylglycerophosphate synthase